MNILDKLRGRTEEQKKIIVWAIVIVFGILLFNFYLKAAVEKIKKEGIEDIGSQMQFPDIEKMINDMPNPGDIKSLPSGTLPFLKENP